MLSGFRMPGLGRGPTWIVLAAIVVAVGVWLVWPDAEQPRGSSISPYHIMSAQEMAPAIFTAAFLFIGVYRLILWWPPRQRDSGGNS